MALTPIVELGVAEAYCDPDANTSGWSAYRRSTRLKTKTGAEIYLLSRFLELSDLDLARLGFRKVEERQPVGWAPAHAGITSVDPVRVRLQATPRRKSPGRRCSRAIPRKPLGLAGTQA